MEMEFKKPECHAIDIDGTISKGKQFDLDITLPEDHRNVIYGVVKNCFKEPVKDAVVKLVEIVYDCGKEERRPIGHTFTDKEGEFVFGPLCPDKKYAIQIWVNDTKKIKICAKCHHEGKCLKGEKNDKCDCFIDKKPECKEKYDYEYEKDECKKDEHKKCDCKKDEYEKEECKKHECKKDEYKKCDCKKDECEKCDYRRM